MYMNVFVSSKLIFAKKIDSVTLRNRLLPREHVQAAVCGGQRQSERDRQQWRDCVGPGHQSFKSRLCARSARAQH